MSNKTIYTLFVGSMLLGSVAGCDDYELKDVPKNIYIDKEAVSLFVGEQEQLKASPTDGTYTFSWTSEDPAVATVSAAGLVQAVGEGSTNIIVTGGPARGMVPVTSVVRIPLQDVVLSESAIELMPGNERNVLVTLVPANANDVPERSWRSTNPEVATVSEVGEIRATGEGVASIVFTIGDIEKTVLVDVSFTRPFRGPHILSAAAPLVLPAANFDFGGQGQAFNDDAGNSLGQDNYRRGHGDAGSFGVEVEGDGTNIGYINAGEWLQYTVEVVDAGEYWLDFALSAAGDGLLRVEIDGENVTGSVHVPNNGSWGAWRMFPEPALVVNLTEGKHKVRFVTEQAGFNLKDLRFVKK